MIMPKASANGVAAQCATAPASSLPGGIMVPNASDHTPITMQVATNGRLTGKKTLVYGSFAPAPDVALASGLLANGLRSRTVAVLIRR